MARFGIEPADAPLALRALVAQWRMREMVAGQFSVETGDKYSAGNAEGNRRCADELEQALKG
jgi:hypothetical protein